MMKTLVGDGRIQSHEQPLEDMYCNDFDDCCYADK